MTHATLPAHIFRELVNDLRDIAVEWHPSQQLRERISGRLRQDVSPSGPVATPCQGHSREQERDLRILQDGRSMTLQEVAEQDREWLNWYLNENFHPDG